MASHTGSVNKALLALVIIGLAAYIVLNEKRAESFSAFYYGPRRDPTDYVRTPRT